MSKPPFPFQPTYTDQSGVRRFRPNRIVEAMIQMLDTKGVDLNVIAQLVDYKNPESMAEWAQLMQLNGYRVSDWGDLTAVLPEWEEYANEMHQESGHHEAAAPVETSQGWEYYTEVHGAFELSEHLDELGNDGWEVFSVTPEGMVYTQTVSQQTYRVTAKRRT